MTTRELEAVMRALHEVLEPHWNWDALNSWAKGPDGLPPNSIGAKSFAALGSESFDDAKEHLAKIEAAARAALSAIREPTERMMHAMGVDHAKDRYVPIQEQNIIDGYTAAIDSILTDTRTPTEGESL